MVDDNELQREVMYELKWEPSIKPERIGVHVDDGVVHLSGEVDSYAQKMAVERAVKQVGGVTAIADDLRVRLPAEYERSDEDLARLAGSALEWNVNVPHDQVKVIVRDNWLTLEGEVDRWYEREAAEEAVKNLVGIKGITNKVTVRPAATPRDIKSQIERALFRHARIDARQVKIEEEDGKVTLRGVVHSVEEKEDVERAVCAAPGITEIDNRLEVETEIPQLGPGH